MKETQKSIGEKLKAIKLQQMANKEKGADDSHTHDPTQFSFIKTTKLQNVHSGAYFYSGNRLRFEAKPTDTEKKAGVVIYKTNSQVYQTAEYVDMMCSWLICFAGYKFFRNCYLMATGAGTLASYGPFTAFWAVAGFV